MYRCILCSVLPVAAIGLIMGVDRMTRTAVNITGDAICTSIVAYQEKAIDLDTYRNTDLK